MMMIKSLSFLVMAALVMTAEGRSLRNVDATSSSTVMEVVDIEQQGTRRLPKAKWVNKCKRDCRQVAINNERSCKHECKKKHTKKSDGAITFQKNRDTCYETCRPNAAIEACRKDYCDEKKGEPKGGYTGPYWNTDKPNDAW